jgi:alcohol dehydrogenase (cytochrome c)
MKWHSRDAMPRGAPMAALAALIVLGFGSAGADEAGLYSDAQALRGQALFDEHCPACHGAQLQGSAAVALSGDTFKAHWADGQHTVDDLFYVMRTQMPFTEPGKLSRQQYIDIAAYVLKVNGYPAGAVELPPVGAELKKMTLHPR